MKHQYRIDGMHCDECARKIQGAIEALPGVISAQVSRTPPQALVAMSQHVETSKLQEAVRGVGEYQISEIKAEQSTSASLSTTTKLKTYFPLILIGAYLIGAVFLRELVLWRFDPQAMMENFMGGFFVIFSFFKLLDLKGFADGYRTYDLVAERYPDYARLYPFLELMLGLLYLFISHSKFVAVLTVLLMGVSSIGVVKAMFERREIQCACLGTIFKLPLTSVTLAEDLLMLGMALLMLMLG